MEYLKESVLPAVLITLFIFLVACSIVYFSDKYDCTKFSQQTGIKTEYYLFGSGCLLEIDGQKIPYEKWLVNTGK